MWVFMERTVTFSHTKLSLKPWLIGNGSSASFVPLDHRELGLFQLDIGSLLDVCLFACVLCMCLCVYVCQMACLV